jgi:hypothetical protein
VSDAFVAVASSDALTGCGVQGFDVPSNPSALRLLLRSYLFLSRAVVYSEKVLEFGEKFGFCTIKYESHLAITARLHLSACSAAGMVLFDDAYPFPFSGCAGVARLRVLGFRV